VVPPLLLQVVWQRCTTASPELHVSVSQNCVVTAAAAAAAGGSSADPERHAACHLVHHVTAAAALLLLLLQVVRQLIQNRMLPAIWFIMSRRDCDLAAIATNVTLVNQQEEAELEQELMTLL
jgi:superfamily II RNA helicase